MSRIRSYLEGLAPLENFWIYKTEKTTPGLINYYSNGQSWTLMDDDEDRLDACLVFLESIGCPIFENVDAMIAHANSFIREE